MCSVRARQGTAAGVQLSCRLLSTALPTRLQLARANKKPTLTSREIQTSVRLVLPGEAACCRGAVRSSGAAGTP